MLDEVVDQMSLSCAFLSTPSIYFSLPVDIREKCTLFDFDSKFSTDKGFVQYDFNAPEAIPVDLHHTFDMVVIDPPFITLEVR